MEIEIDRKLFEKIIKQHSKYVYYGSTILNSLVVEGKNKTISFYSTDGNKLLVTNLDFDEKINFKRVILDMNYLKNIKFMKHRFNKSLIQNIMLKITQKKFIIKDFIYNIQYEVPILNDNYPEVLKLVKQYENKEHLTIGINKDYLKSINELITNDKNKAISINIIKDKSVFEPLILKSVSNNSNINQTALIMPINLKE